MLSLLLLAALSPAAEPSSCASIAACNSEGTKAYQAGRFDDAVPIFERQIDYADTAIQELESQDKPVDAKTRNARETALNNALLALIKGGQCLKARAYLTLTDPAAGATIANRKLYEQRCKAAVAEAEDQRIGDYWQYAGHGAWNQATIREAADGSIELDAFFMRISRGPMDEYGPAAFGSHSGIKLDVSGAEASGSYEGDGEDTRCTLSLRWVDQGIEVEPQQRDECNTGGAGARFAGRYEYVSTTPSPPDETVQ